MKTLYLLLALVLVACSDNPLTPGTNDPPPITSDTFSVRGTITFVNTNFCTNGYYAVSLFSDSIPPFNSAPIKSSQLSISGNTANYIISNVDSGFYFVAVTWLRNPNPHSPPAPILGIWACDTTGSPCNPTFIEVPNYSGNYNLNIISWTDTLRRLN